MGSYKLSANAKADLLRIYEHGLERWGEAQADRYYNDLFDRFEQIAEQPDLYPRVDHIREVYRRSVCGVENIYYRVEENTVEIISVVGRQGILG